MIDMETEIFSEVSSKVREEFPEIYITGEYVKAPPSFPCVSLIEIDNATFRNSQTNESKENHVAVSYEVNIYSNKLKGRKAECKKIAAFIDEILMKLNFTRMMLEPVPNQEEVNIHNFCII